MPPRYLRVYYTSLYASQVPQGVLYLPICLPMYLPGYTPPYTPWVHLLPARHRAGYAADLRPCWVLEPWAQLRRNPWVGGSQPLRDLESVKVRGRMMRRVTPVLP